MKKTGFLCLLAVSICGTSCLKDKTAPQDSALCGTTIVSYSQDIVPIINSSCATHQGPGTGCHDAWIFEYDNIVPYIENDAFYNHVFVDKSMPQIPNNFGIDSLTADEYKALKCWLNQGYPEN